MADKVDLHQYRFRVKTGAGQELVGPIATVRRQEPQIIALATSTWVEVPVTQILVYVKGKQQGDFKADAGFTKGDPGFAERPGTVPVHLFSTDELFFSVHTPRDPQSGMPTGKRIYVPVTFVKNNGPSTPQFYQALVNNESLPTVVFDCYGLDSHGKTGLAHSVKLTNASVASVDFSHPDIRAVATSKLYDCAQVALTFQEIEVTHGPIVASDKW
jgi:type VI secretion system secreted protein Hcp